MATAAVDQPRKPAVIEESRSSRIARAIGKTPIHLILIFVGLLWLMPTIGLFLTSLLAPENVAEGGWWQVFSEPSKMTWDNYSNLFDNEGMVQAIIRTAWITIGATILPVIVASLAGYALAWLDFPGR